jgi:hypothetical protein
MTAKDYDEIYRLAKQQRVSMAEYIRQQLRAERAEIGSRPDA